jgi:copper(I)-binding protein
LIVLLVALGLIAAGCGGDSGVSVDKPWARSSPMMANAGAIYMELSSSDGDRLMGASVGASIAGTVEIHETTMVEHEMDDDAMDDDHEEDGHMPGAMMMQEVGEIDLPAGTMVALAPGGYHIMLLDIASPLEVGQMIELTLTFQNAGEKMVEVEVREEAP